MNKLPAQRTLHLIDVENLVGDGKPTPGIIADCRSRYESLGLVELHDHVVVACNPFVAVDVGTAWPARLLTRHGPSGADLALLSVMTSECIESRFAAVVVASGDGVFTDEVVRLQAAGVPVTVVARRCSLSASLRLATQRVVLFDPPRDPPVAPALEVA